MTPREIEEYRALRDTIRERGTQRVWIALAGLTAWGSLVVATIALAPWPVATLLPLLLLATTFECICALHMAVERVGRYLQVFFEDDESVRRWEHQAMAYSTAFAGRGPGGPGRADPLFAALFGLAAVFNFIPVVVAGAVPMEYGVTGALHLVFLMRLLQARRQADRQRAIDLERFKQLRDRPL